MTILSANTQIILSKENLNLETKNLFTELCHVAENYFPEGSNIEKILLNEIVNRCIINYSNQLIRNEIQLYKYALPILLEPIKNQYPDLCLHINYCKFI